MSEPQELEPRMPDVIERHRFGDDDVADAPLGGSLAPAHHHPAAATDLERDAASRPDPGIAHLEAAAVASAAVTWTPEELLAAKRAELAAGARPVVLAELDRQLAAKIAGAAPSMTPPA